MMLECKVREDLMLEYIRAGSQLPDRAHPTDPGTEPSARNLASSLIDRALSRRSQALRQLLKHCDEHGC
jgi:hypothetical protein